MNFTKLNNRDILAFEMHIRYFGENPYFKSELFRFKENNACVIFGYNIENWKKDSNMMFLVIGQILVEYYIKSPYINKTTLLERHNDYLTGYNEKYLHHVLSLIGDYI